MSYLGFGFRFFSKTFVKRPHGTEWLGSDLSYLLEFDKEFHCLPTNSWSFLYRKVRQEAIKERIFEPFS